MVEKSQAVGAAQIGAGAYLGYQGIKHGLPRAAGIRIEYHTTSKENADLIKKAGNILDPAFGGKNGWAEKVQSSSYVNNSKNYVHITGVHKDSDAFKYLKVPESAKAPVKTIGRKLQTFMYKTVGNSNFEDIKNSLGKGSKKDVLKWFGGNIKKIMLNDKTKTFCIPGIDSYFNKEFITDVDDAFAMKSTKPIKAFNNRFSAMIDGLKTFGLKGIKENKGRVAFGVGLLSLGTYYGAKLISKGIKNITGTPEQEA